MSQKYRLLGGVVVGLTLAYATVILFRHYDEVTACDGIENHYGQVKKSWQDGELFVLLRHTEKCSAVENACPADDDGITEAGLDQAELVGRGLSRLGKSDADILYSPTKRTAQTAKAALTGDMSPQLWLTEGCKVGLLEKIKSRKRPGKNLVLVTHSSCLNALQDEDQKRILSFNAGRDRFYGVSVIFRQKEDDRVEVFGCILPSQWKQVEDKVSAI